MKVPDDDAVGALSRIMYTNYDVILSVIASKILDEIYCVNKLDG